MDWAQHGADWPNHAHSRFVQSRPHHWHVQQAGSGPQVLLLHGAAGATQSWRGVFPRLAAGGFTVIAPDLPGQGFTRLGSRHRSGLPATAEDLWRLCDTEGWAPDLIVGHSVGAAIALQMVMMRAGPRGVMGLNGALGTFDGLAGWMFPAMAKMMAMAPFVPGLFARMSGSQTRVRDLLRSTGSEIDDEGARLYQWLASDPGHVDGTLLMMAQWRINGLLARLHRIDLPVQLVVGANDGTVAPDVSTQAAARMAQAEVVTLDGLGHLAHEEAPDTVTTLIASFAHRVLSMDQTPT